MGGWISLLVAREVPSHVAGLVGIAAAPDFTEDSKWAGFTAQQREALEVQGQVALPSEYGPEPYVITRRLIEDGAGIWCCGGHCTFRSRCGCCRARPIRTCRLRWLFGCSTMPQGRTSGSRW